METWEGFCVPWTHQWNQGKLDHLSGGQPKRSTVTTRLGEPGGNTEGRGRIISQTLEVLSLESSV